MKLSDFYNLDYERKLEVVNNAVCISGRSEQKFIVLLFQVDAFYIEVYYRKKYNYINSLFAFEETELLEPYLQKMNLSFII